MSEVTGPSDFMTVNVKALLYRHNGIYKGELKLSHRKSELLPKKELFVSITSTRKKVDFALDDMLESWADTERKPHLTIVQKNLVHSVLYQMDKKWTEFFRSLTERSRDYWKLAWSTRQIQEFEAYRRSKKLIGGSIKPQERPVVYFNDIGIRYANGVKEGIKVFKRKNYSVNNKQFPPE